MVDAIVWWLTLEVLGVAAWPVAWIVMRRLPDRGWAFSKPLGLLLVGYAAWMIGMFQLAPFGRGSNIFMLLVLAGGSAWLALRNGRALATEMVAFLRGQARFWIFAEILFGLAFVAWAILRAYSPSIFGTEKFMDFAFLNSFTQGQVLPPNDPWLAGYSINYYYFGYTLMATLCHLSGVDSAVGFNLANVTLVSLTMLGTFGLVYNLVAGVLRGRRSTVPVRSPGARASAPIRAASAQVTARSGVPALPTRRVGGGGIAVAEPEDRPPAGASDAAPEGLIRARRRSLTGSEPVGALAAPDTEAPAPGNGQPGIGGNGNGHAVVAPAARQRDEQPRPPWSALAAGVLASFLVMIVGNMAGADQVLHQHQTIDTFNWWNPSRVIHDALAPLGGETINEFPFFSFMLNDMHPHMLALPFVVLVLGLALALLKSGALRPRTAAEARARRHGLLAAGLDNRLRLFIYALATGALFVINTWDYPTYLLLVLLALVLPILGTPAARWLGEESPAPLADGEATPARPGGALAPVRAWRESRLGSLVTQAAALVVLGLLLFLPFQLTFKSFAGSEPMPVPPAIASLPILGGLAQRFSSIIGINIWPKTWEGFMAIFGLFFYAAAIWALVLLGRAILAAARAERPNLTPLFALGGVVAVCLVGAVLLQFPLLALLPPLLALAVYLVRERLQPGRWSSEELFVLCLLGLGALITFGTEVFFLQDVFHSRFNTLFKFYYQVWVLWGLAAAFAAWWLLAWAFGRRAVPGGDTAPLPAKLLAGAWTAGFVVLFGLAMIYPALAPAARDNGIAWVPFIQVANPQDHKLRGLDGIQFLADQAPGDLAAIRWLRANASGADGIAEAAYTQEYNMQGMHGRVSAYTGMPTIVAWHGHEVQWRGGQPQVEAELGPREADQDELYATTDIARAKQIMQKYHLRYVFVGTIERAATGRPQGTPYSAAALDKFRQFMQPVFDQGGTTVYKLPDSVALAPGGGPNPGALPHP